MGWSRDAALGVLQRGPVAIPEEDGMCGGGQGGQLTKQKFKGNPARAPELNAGCVAFQGVEEVEQAL